MGRARPQDFLGCLARTETLLPKRSPGCLARLPLSWSFSYKQQIFAVSDHWHFSVAGFVIFKAELWRQGNPKELTMLVFSSEKALSQPAFFLLFNVFPIFISHTQWLDVCICPPTCMHLHTYQEYKEIHFCSYFSQKLTVSIFIHYYIFSATPWHQVEDAIGAAV